MILLDATTKTIEVLLAGVPSSQCPIVASFADIQIASMAAVGFASSDTVTNSTTPVTAVAAPSSGNSRKVEYLSVYNASNATQTVTVQLNDNSTIRILQNVAISSGETLTFIDSAGWFPAAVANTFTNPMTTLGDLIEGGVSGTPTRLGIGTTGQLLQSNGTTALWVTFIGSSSITTLGTIATGVWNGTSVSVAHGGTGLSTTTPYAVLTGGTTSTGNLQQVSGLGTSGYVLTSNGAAALPTWQASSGTPLAIGDSIGSAVDYEVLVADASGNLGQVSGVGTSGQVLTSNGASALPTWQASSGGSGAIAQVVESGDGVAAFVSGLPITINTSPPTNSEGAQFYSVTITPTNASSTLQVEALLNCNVSNAGNNAIAMIFRDATANALGVGLGYQATAGNSLQVWVSCPPQSAGSTSSTTFKLRAGVDSSNTLYVNSYSGGGLFGGTWYSFIRVTEILP